MEGLRSDGGGRRGGDGHTIRESQQLAWGAAPGQEHNPRKPACRTELGEGRRENRPEAKLKTSYFIPGLSKAVVGSLLGRRGLRRRPAVCRITLLGHPVKVTRQCVCPGTGYKYDPIPQEAAWCGKRSFRYVHVHFRDEKRRKGQFPVLDLPTGVRRWGDTERETCTKK